MQAFLVRSARAGCLSGSAACAGGSDGGRSNRRQVSFFAILVTLATLLAPPPAAATKLIARYAFDETSAPTRNDSAGINTVATEVGDTGFLYNAGSVLPGDYGLLTIGDTQLGATGGLSSGDGSWVTAGNNEFGALTNDFTVM